MLEVVLPTATATAGFILGLAVRRPRPAGAQVSPPPICPCGGPISFHEGGTGRCHHQVERACKWDLYGGELAYEWVPCGCLHYAGPELVSSITMQAVSMRPAVAAADPPQEKTDD
jgi:hypothetical protein